MLQGSRHREFSDHQRLSQRRAELSVPYSPPSANPAIQARKSLSPGTSENLNVDFQSLQVQECQGQSPRPPTPSAGSGSLPPAWPAAQRGNAPAGLHGAVRTSCAIPSLPACGSRDTADSQPSPGNQAEGPCRPVGRGAGPGLRGLGKAGARSPDSWDLGRATICGDNKAAEGYFEEEF